MLYSTILCFAATTIIAINVASGQFLCFNSDGNAVAVTPSIAQCCADLNNNYMILIAGEDTLLSCFDFASLQSQLLISSVPDPIALNQNAVLNCDVSVPNGGEATADISWFFPNGSLAVQDTLVSSMDQLRLPLDITPFEVGDLGSYFCSAMVTSTSFPGISATLQQEVTIDPPAGLMPPANIMQSNPPVLGEPYTLTCEVNGEGNNIQWERSSDEQIVVSDPVRGITVGSIISENGTTRRTLSFQSLSSMDTDIYTCVNTVQDVSEAVSVNLTSPDIVFSSMPVNGPTVGEPFELFCEASVPSSLNAQVFVELISPEQSLIASGEGQNSASISAMFANFLESDAGDYLCEVVVSSPLADFNFTSSAVTTIAPIVDQCALQNLTCDTNANCVPVEDIFVCVCNAGFTGDGQDCIEIDMLINECDENIDDCHPNATCIDLEDGFSCVCDAGFTGNGTLCSDIDECALETDNCDDQMVCSYSRSSTNGYYYVVEKICRPRANCTNTVGSFVCTCNDGFEGDGIECNDINECNEGLDNCLSGAKCINKLGDFVCRCKRGEVGDGIDCCISIGDILDSEGRTRTGTRTRTRTRTRRRAKKRKSKSGRKSKSRSSVAFDDEESSSTRSTRTETGTQTGTHTRTGTRTHTRTGTRTRTTGVIIPPECEPFVNDFITRNLYY